MDRTEYKWRVEYAKSSRAGCKTCWGNIDKDILRMANMVQSPMFDGMIPQWHHYSCFWAKYKVKSHADIGGFHNIRWDDQVTIKERISRGGWRPGCSGDYRKRKLAADEADSGPSAKIAKGQMSPEDKALKEQNDFMWQIRDNLALGKVTGPNVKVLLEENDQVLPKKGGARLYDRVVDCMAFGALLPCPECQGQLVVSAGTGYHCTGNLTAWTRCRYNSFTAEREDFTIPKSLQKKKYLKTFEFEAFNNGVRVFPSESGAPPVSGAAAGAAGSSSKKSSDNLTYLTGVKVALAGRLSQSAASLTKIINGLGGEVMSTVNPLVACVITNEAELRKMSNKMKDARRCDVHVVTEDFLDAVRRGGDAATMITESSISNWGADPKTRIAKDVTDAPGPSFKRVPTKSALVSDREEREYTMSVPKKMKMMLKGGGAVDPESGIASIAHVLKKKGKLYTATLGMVDIARGANSYYKLQLLESDSHNGYWIFRAWGRVGTTIGGNKLQSMGNNKKLAKKEFKTLYREKTGNKFGTKKFRKSPNKFFPLDIDYGDDEEKMAKMNEKAGTTTKLDPAIQQLVKMIFDINTLKKTLVEFEIDLEKMPLGKLSRKQIEDAYKVLTELQKLVEDKASQNLLLDASNRFYTLIPHNFGMKNIPLLDDLETIKTKAQMLDSLLEIEIAYSMLKADADSGDKDPLDAHYEQLKCCMEVVDHDSDEFKLIKEYTKNTHAATHSSYKLEVQEVFKLDRADEASRYKPFQQLHNRQLLWHGSRVSNYAGILSQGLRIAPPEAPVTGYMFGKGVYFADMVSKSANYCHAYGTNPLGLMLLCEVALGNMYELTGAKPITKLPKGMHSAKGLGKTGPDPSGNLVQPDGVVVPKGTGTRTGPSNTSLLYNEYIVYDTAQIRMKYLIKMNFKQSTPW
ncbi:poly [ADP-ribose] polymerase 1-like isoform X2 [Amphiura filiformis]|uniref:poly [ADP-ribose] polymerase 1-like isoform X2 n=1 Tax=Amphiura filiformis TaxID=82378 RepID=UPI003B21F460